MSRTLAILQEGRRRELEQALFYRALSGSAELAGDGGAAERLNDLLADEQHHVSRLAARIVELGGRPEGAVPAQGAHPPLNAWERAAAEREDAEVAWYEGALALVGDEGTRSILSEILASERHHRERLAGKWMPAGPTTPKEGL